MSLPKKIATFISHSTVGLQTHPLVQYVNPKHSSIAQKQLSHSALTRAEPAHCVLQLDTPGGMCTQSAWHIAKMAYRYCYKVCLAFPSLKLGLMMGHFFLPIYYGKMLPEFNSFTID